MTKRKNKKIQLQEITERKKQLREKAIKAFGDIQLKNLTYTQSPSKIVSDQNILLTEKHKEFFKENKDEILSVLDFIKKVDNGRYTDIDEHMFDITNVNTKFEQAWYNSLLFVKDFVAYPVGLAFALGGLMAAGKVGTYFFEEVNILATFGLIFGTFGGFGAGMGLAECPYHLSKITKRVNEIRSNNRLFIDAYLYNDDYCKNILENKI